MTAASAPGTPRRWGTLAGAALLVAAVTVLARIVGFGRWLAFAHTVGDTCLGDAYNTANQVPNVLFEIVAGGALAGVVVPVVASALLRGDRAEAARTASALLTVAVLALVPVGVVLALAARPVVSLLLGSPGPCGDPTVDVAATMLLLFVPQIFCYAVAVVVSGLLQADRRFLAAAVAPLVSSLVVIASYVLFRGLAGAEVAAPDLVPRSALGALALGTTLGVVALAATTVAGLRGTGLVLRPALRFPPGVAARARRLAGSGLAMLAAQQVSVLVVAWTANSWGMAGTLTLFVWAQAVFLLPYAVLALPIATSAFPHLAARHASGEPDGLRRMAAGGARAVVLAACLGAGLLAGTCVPVARVFVLGPGSGDHGPLAWALVAFAPGVLGLGLMTYLSRVLFAVEAARAAAVVATIGWGGVGVASLAVVAGLAPSRAVAGLAAAASAGLLAGAAAAAVLVVRCLGAGATAGLGRALAAGLAAAAAGAAAGAVVGSLFDHFGVVASVAGALLAGAVVLSGYAFVALLLDRTGVLQVLAHLRPRTVNAGAATDPGGAP